MFLEIPSRRAIADFDTFSDRYNRRISAQFSNVITPQGVLEVLNFHPTITAQFSRVVDTSTLLDSGESILALSEYLGHADPGFTLRTYTHLMPSSTERTKTAIDAMLAGNALEPDPENDADGSEP